MRLSAHEKSRLTQSRYSEEELSKMSWRELSKLSRFSHQAIRYRVVEMGMSYRDAITKPQTPRTSKVSQLAEEHNLGYSTLMSRKRRNPNVPLEVLAKQPLLDPCESSRRANDQKRRRLEQNQTTSSSSVQ